MTILGLDDQGLYALSEIQNFQLIIEFSFNIELVWFGISNLCKV